MRADRDQRMRRSLRDLVPVHQRLRLGARGSTPFACASAAENRALIILAHFNGRSVQPRIGANALLRRVEQSSFERPSAVSSTSMPRAYNLLDHLPPQIDRAVDQPRRDVDGDRRAVLFQDRQRLGQIVAIGVVGGDRCEAPGAPALRQASQRLVQRDELIAVGLHVRDQRIEKVRRDVEMPVEAMRLSRMGGDAVQHQDRADAADQRSRQPGQPGKGKTVQHQLGAWHRRRRTFIHL